MFFFLILAFLPDKKPHLQIRPFIQLKGLLIFIQVEIIEKIENTIIQFFFFNL